MASQFRVSLSNWSALVVIHSSLVERLATQGIVEWSDVLEVPRIPVIKGKDFVRMRFGIAVGLTQYKFMVRFVDIKDMARDSIVLGGYELDTVGGTKCLSHVFRKDETLERAKNGLVTYNLYFKKECIKFDILRTIQKSKMTRPCYKSLIELILFRNRKSVSTLSEQPRKISNSYDVGLGLDVDIIIDGQTIKASKYTLSQFSPVFANMFTIGSESNDFYKIHIDGTRFEVMNSLIRVIHGIPCDVDVTMALGMLIVAEKYQITEIQRQIEELIKSNINQQNVVNVLIVADKLQLEDLKSKALQFIRTRVIDKQENLNNISSASPQVTSMIKETMDTNVGNIQCRPLL